ncbi:MAG: AbrB/MazE/SpoVT family DNA-binding domain-containing protein [Actinobacteria bacterium]|nr:AbrB/MazE/SpoVT family DNA-binding domain-containing protein [Actinomycetota bacterium]
MSEGKEVQVRLRPKRQLTLPPEICASLSLEPGDLLDLKVEGDALVARPKKKKALVALEEIRACFERSGISEEELLKAGRKARRKAGGERVGGR